MLHIRRYKSSDHKVVVALHREAYKAIGIEVGTSSWDEDLNHIEDTYLSAQGEFLVGTLESEVVAMGALLHVRPGIGEIKRMRVSPRHQRRGFGQEILSELELRARLSGYIILQLNTTIIQEGAQKFYLKNGYKEVRRVAKGKIGGHETIFYKKDLVEEQRQKLISAYREETGASQDQAEEFARIVEAAAGELAEKIKERNLL